MNKLFLLSLLCVCLIACGEEETKPKNDVDGTPDADTGDASGSIEECWEPVGKYGFTYGELPADATINDQKLSFFNGSPYLLVFYNRGNSEYNAQLYRFDGQKWEKSGARYTSPLMIYDAVIGDGRFFVVAAEAAEGGGVQYVAADCWASCTYYEPLAQDYTTGSASITLDNNKTPVVAYTLTASNELRVSWGGGAGWPEIGGSNGGDYVITQGALNPKVVYRGLNDPAVIFIDAAAGDDVRVMQYGSSWVTLGNEPFSDMYDPSSLFATAENDQLYLLYRTMDDTLILRHWNSYLWETLGDKNVFPGAAAQPRLYSSAGLLYVAYERLAKFAGNSGEDKRIEVFYHPNPQVWASRHPNATSPLIGRKPDLRYDVQVGDTANHLYLSYIQKADMNGDGSIEEAVTLLKMKDSCPW